MHDCWFGGVVLVCSVQTKDGLVMTFGKLKASVWGIDVQKLQTGEQ
jgi:hypothetical protein